MTEEKTKTTNVDEKKKVTVKGVLLKTGAILVVKAPDTLSMMITTALMEMVKIKVSKVFK